MEFFSIPDLFFIFFPSFFFPSFFLSFFLSFSLPPFLLLFLSPDYLCAKFPR